MNKSRNEVMRRFALGRCRSRFLDIQPLDSHYQIFCMINAMEFFFRKNEIVPEFNLFEIRKTSQSFILRVNDSTAEKDSINDGQHHLTPDKMIRARR